MSESLERFISWAKLKIRIHLKDGEIPYFREKEVWWCALGKNIGYETDGKNELYSRPVVIVKKYSKDMCFVLPLSTQIKKGKVKYQYVVYCNDQDNAVNLTQGRTISSKRLLKKMGNIQREEFDGMVNAFMQLLQ